MVIEVVVHLGAEGKRDAREVRSVGKLLLRAFPGRTGEKIHTARSSATEQPTPSSLGEAEGHRRSEGESSWSSEGGADARDPSTPSSCLQISTWVARQIYSQSEGQHRELTRENVAQCLSGRYPVRGIFGGELLEG